jgi:Carboxypeptidase regulatory-like domain
MMRKMAGVVVTALACLVLLPTVARAQSVITGVVKDTTGAVLPGVTVEASSDALIEKSKSAVTDGEGVYRIVDLRPGSYVVTFQLSGFSTVRREGLQLPSEFTMTINTDLKVGSLEESITVSGDAPVVDVSTTVHTQVMNRETLDSLPSGRTIQGLGQLVVGVALSIPDVGGSRAMQQTYMSTHGMTSSNNTVLVDGLMVNGLQSDGSVQSYFNDAMNQEVSYQTSGIGAETSAGGVRLNMIPREGGNKFSGAFFASYRSGDWQSDNFDQDLKDRGLPNASAIDKIGDFNFSIGGPIKKDKLWFFTSARHWSVDAPIAGTFVTDGSGPEIARCLAAAKTSSPCEQGIDDQRIRSAMGRMTYQISPKNKLTAYFDEIDKFRGHAMFAGDDYNTAAIVWNSPAYHTAAAKWSSPVSSRLFLEAGYSNNTEDYTNEPLEGVNKPRFSQAWFASAPRRDLDLVSTSVHPLISNTSTQSPLRYNVQGSVAYVTGSHSLKAGAQRTWGHFGHTRDGNGDLDQQYRSQATGIPFTRPDSVVIYNTPYASREELAYDFGVFAQDQWTLKRLTINAGLRWEWVNAKVPAQSAPAGRFVAARNFAEIPNVPNQSDPAPRFGLAYDLFGNGKTALKYSLNRYNAARTTGDAQSGAQRYNPLSSDTRTLNWIDLNGDDIAQGPVGCTYQTAGCEINYFSATGGYLLEGFGGNRILTRQDPDIQRTWNLEQGIEIQHELFPRMSVTASYYHGAFHDLLFSDNQNISLSDWTAVKVFDPMDGSPMTIYDITPAAKGRARDVLDSTSSNRSRKFDSFGVQMNVRLPRNATVFGGFSFDRLVENNCDEPDNPNLLRFCDESNLDAFLPDGDPRRGYKIPFLSQGKISGSVDVKYGIQLSGSFQSNAGYPNRSLTTTRTGIDGRNTGGTSWLLGSTTTYPTVNGVPYCPACPNGVAPWTAGQRVLPTLQGTDSSTNLTIRLKPYGAEGEYTDRINQLDLKVSKSFAFGRVRVLPAVEIFNVFNANPVILQRSTQYTAPPVTGGVVQPNVYNQPSGILNGRIIGLGAQVRW